MSEKEDNNWRNLISNAQKELREFVYEKELLNSKLKTLILNFQSIDSKIHNRLFSARDFYTEKRSTYNLKIEKLKSKKYEYERLWNSLDRKLKSLSKPELDPNILTSIDYTRRSIEDIENNLIKITRMIDEQILDIDEENEMIEKLRELESDKQKKVNLLTELEHKQAITLQNSKYYITKKEKETLEKDLVKIYENLFNLSNKRLMTHKKMLEMYRIAREFVNTKKQIEKELIENKSDADAYHLLFLKLMNLNKKLLFEELSNKEKSKVRTRKMPKTKIKEIIKKKRDFKRFEQKKLKIALNKQKSGKKLDFYELQLILKHSKN